MRSSTSRMGMAVTLGKAAVTADCTASSSARETRAVASQVVGAPSSAPWEKMTKKLVLKVCHSTRRRLNTRAVTVTPWMSNPSVLPMVTPRFFAMSSSTEIRGSRAASAAAHVSTYSRERYHTSSRRCRGSRDTGAPSIEASRERTTGVRAGSRPVRSVRSWRKGWAWSGWMSMKKKAGARAGPRSASSVRRLCSSKATATISITASPRETSTVVPGEPGQPRQPAGDLDDEPSAHGEEDQRGDKAPDEDPSHLEGARFPDGERTEPDHDGQNGQPGASTAQSRLHVVAEDQRGRHAPDVEEGPESKQQGQTGAHGKARAHGAHGQARVERHGHERREQGRERPLHGGADGRAEQAAPESQQHRLEEIGGEDRAPADAQALEHGDGVELAAHEGAHARGDTDPADHEGDETGQPEIDGELAPEPAHAGLCVGVGGDAHAGIGETRGERVLEGLGRLPGGEAKEQAVAHAAARPDEVRGIEVARVDQHARAEREDAHRAIGLLAKDAAHGEIALADPEPVADAEAEPREQ